MELTPKNPIDRICCLLLLGVDYLVVGCVLGFRCLSFLWWGKVSVGSGVRDVFWGSMMMKMMVWWWRGERGCGGGRTSDDEEGR